MGIHRKPKYISKTGDADILYADNNRPGIKPGGVFLFIALDIVELQYYKVWWGDSKNAWSNEKFPLTPEGFSEAEKLFKNLINTIDKDFPLQIKRTNFLESERIRIETITFRDKFKDWPKGRKLSKEKIKQITEELKTKSTFELDKILQEVKSVKVLYCGMADDIISPLQLVPNLTHLYVIDSFDVAFSPDYTWDGQKEDILTTLKLGSDEKSHHRAVYMHYQKNVPINQLDEPCIITEEDDIDVTWRVKFTYKGINRELIYFHHRRFDDPWPTEIKDIQHLISIGATFPTADYTLRNMIINHCKNDALYYEQHNSFSEMHNLYEYKGLRKLIKARGSMIIISDLVFELRNPNGEKRVESEIFQISKSIEEEANTKRHVNSQR